MSDSENGPMSDGKANHQGRTNSSGPAGPVAEDVQGEQIRDRWLRASLKFDRHSEEYKVMAMMLSVAVPLYIQRFLNRGGVTKEDFLRVASYNDELGRADNLFFRAKREGEIASFFNKVAESMAVLSFVPGGIELFDVSYESLPLQDQTEKKTSPGKSTPAHTEKDGKQEVSLRAHKTTT